MTDTILVQTNTSGQRYAHQIWRGTLKSELIGKFTKELTDAMVEKPDNTVNENDLYDGADFSAPNNSPA